MFEQIGDWEPIDRLTEPLIESPGRIGKGKWSSFTFCLIFFYFEVLKFLPGGPAAIFFTRHWTIFARQRRLNGRIC